MSAGQEFLVRIAPPMLPLPDVARATGEHPDTWRHRFYAGDVAGHKGPERNSRIKLDTRSVAAYLDRKAGGDAVAA